MIVWSLYSFEGNQKGLINHKATLVKCDFIIAWKIRTMGCLFWKGWHFLCQLQRFKHLSVYGFNNNALTTICFNVKIVNILFDGRDFFVMTFYVIYFRVWDSPTKQTKKKGVVVELKLLIF